MDSKTSTTIRTASKSQALPVEQMDRYYVKFRCVICICSLDQLIVLRLDHEILYCKTIIVCNG